MRQALLIAVVIGLAGGSAALGQERLEPFLLPDAGEADQIAQNIGEVRENLHEKLRAQPFHFSLDTFGTYATELALPRELDSSGRFRRDDDLSFGLSPTIRLIYPTEQIGIVDSGYQFYQNWFDENEEIDQQRHRGWIRDTFELREMWAITLGGQVEHFRLGDDALGTKYSFQFRSTALIYGLYGAALTYDFSVWDNDINSQQDADQHNIGVQFLTLIPETKLWLQSGYISTLNDAKASFFGFDRHTFYGVAGYQIDDAAQLTGWLIGGFADYDATNPTAGDRREDTFFTVKGRYDRRLNNWCRIYASVSWTGQDSTLAVHDYDNVVVTLGTVFEY